MGLYGTLSINDTQRMDAQYDIVALVIVILSLTMLSAIKLNFTMVSVVMLNYT